MKIAGIDECCTRMSREGVSILSMSFTAVSLGLRTVLGTQKALGRKRLSSGAVSSYSSARWRDTRGGG